VTISGETLPPAWWHTDHGNLSYAGGTFQNARCVLCHALYVAWIDGPPCRGYWREKHERGVKTGEFRFVDLSFRRAFNDEPSPEDCPVYEVEEIVTYRRKPIPLVPEKDNYRHYASYRTRYTDEEIENARKQDSKFSNLDWMIQRNADIDAYEQRREAEVAEVSAKRSVADDLARFTPPRSSPR